MELRPNDDLQQATPHEAGSIIDENSAEVLERTRETEIKSNIEFWRSEGIEVNEEEVREAIGALPEIEGFGWYLVMPKGMRNDEIWGMIKAEIPAERRRSVYEKCLVNYVDAPRTPQKLYAVAARYNQEPDADSLGENAKLSLDYEKDGAQYMTPTEWMVAELRWFRENHTHLDMKNCTLCPNCRTENGTIPILTSSLVGVPNFIHTEMDVDDIDSKRGVRKVLTAEPIENK